MSNSVAFLLVAFGLSAFGATAVWLHGRPRRNRRENNDFGATLRALSESRRSSMPASGVRPQDPNAPPMSARDPRRSKESGPGS